MRRGAFLWVLMKLCSFFFFSCIFSRWGFSFWFCWSFLSCLGAAASSKYSRGQYNYSGKPRTRFPGRQGEIRCHGLGLYSLFVRIKASADGRILYQQPALFARRQQLFLGLINRIDQDFLDGKPALTFLLSCSAWIELQCVVSVCWFAGVHYSFDQRSIHILFRYWQLYCEGERILSLL